VSLFPQYCCSKNGEKIPLKLNSLFFLSAIMLSKMAATFTSPKRNKARDIFKKIKATHY
jgi:hypothetical protein